MLWSWKLLWNETKIHECKQPDEYNFGNDQGGVGIKFYQKEVQKCSSPIKLGEKKDKKKKAPLLNIENRV